MYVLAENTAKKRLKRILFKEDKDIVKILESLKEELDIVYMKLSYTTDEVLIDSYIYELKALNMKYQYYLKLAKNNQHTITC